MTLLVAAGALAALPLAHCAAVEAPAGPIDIAPRVAPPKGAPVQRAPRTIVSTDGIRLENASLVARFSTANDRLRLVSLWSEYLHEDVLAFPEQTHLFLVDIGGHRTGADDWRVVRVAPLSPSEARVTLESPGHELRADLTLGAGKQGMSLALALTNASDGPQSWKAVFPQLGGLRLTRDGTGDFYFFPLWGGAIGRNDANLRTFYGAGSALWQMIDVFAPDLGGGVALRSLDTAGTFKGMALRKGTRADPGFAFDHPVAEYGMDPGMGWTNSLDGNPAIAVGIETLRYARPAGGTVTLPAAELSMHAGDWHQPMRAYADWAHAAWRWRGRSDRLRDVWNIQPVGWGQSPLFAKGRWRTDFIDPKADASELMSWWEWSGKGPWGVSMDALRDKLGSSFYDRYRSYWVVNPATGKLAYPLNRGDYDYNAAWGGLPALRSELDAIRHGGQLPMLYVDPVTVDDNTRLGQQFGRQYGVMNPTWKDPYRIPVAPPGYVSSYGGWQMDVDSAWFRDFIVGQVLRIARETGVDGIRLDEFGSAGYVDSNPRHRHLFAEPGQNAWLQATTAVCRQLHDALDGIDPQFVLTNEHTGYDYLAATVEGSLDLEPVGGPRPVALNLFRFYFPEHRIFDQGDRSNPSSEEQRFWNAVGAFGALYSPAHQAVLKENADVFAGGKAEPLVPTLVGRVYANRFWSREKELVLLYNATGRDVSQPLLATGDATAGHYFDLLRGEDVPAGKGSVSIAIPANRTAALARFPRLIGLNRSREGLAIVVSARTVEPVVAFFGKDGTEFDRKAVKPGGRIPVPPDLGAKLAFVKLFSGRYLVDARQVIP